MPCIRKKTMSPTEKTHTYKNCRIRYVDIGSGIPALFLHGHCCCYTDWDKQFDALADDLRMIAPDMPCYGRSDPGELPHNYRWTASALWDLLDNLGIDRVILMGHSAGEAAIQAMVELAPQRTAGIVIVDAGPLCVLCDDSAIAGAAASPELKALRQKNQPRLEELGYPWAYPSDESVACLESYLDKRRDYVRITGSESTPEGDPHGQWAGDLPTLVFAAGQGVMKQADLPQDWAVGRAPSTHTQLIVAHESGHWVMREMPDLVNREILTFYENLWGLI